MASKVLKLKVIEVDKNKMTATLIDSTEIDDVMKIELFMPAHFGGESNPHLKVGEEVNVAYRSWGGEMRIQQCWRPRDEHLVVA